MSFNISNIRVTCTSASRIDSNDRSKYQYKFESEKAYTLWEQSGDNKAYLVGEDYIFTLEFTDKELNETSRSIREIGIDSSSYNIELDTQSYGITLSIPRRFMDKWK